jgi:hypothetical protein
VHDPVAITLKGAAQRAFGLRMPAAAATIGITGERRQRPADVALEAEAAV